MRRPARFVLLALLAGLAMPAADEPPPARQYPPAGELIAKAIEWANWHEKQEFHRQWTFGYHRTTRHLNDAEQVKSTESVAYTVYPLAGEQFYEKVRHDGRPLSPSEQRKEEKRKQEFVEQAKKGKVSGSVDDDFKFDQELISRYRAEVVGMEDIAGRSAYIVAFEPKDGPLPVRRRIDHALNSSRGKLWIDARDYIVLQIEFELLKPVRIWAGILGSVSSVRGRVTLTELGGGAWHYQHMDLYMKGRVLFSSFHEARRMEWSNFERITEQAAR